jgi:hypothetical protein
MTGFALPLRNMTALALAATGLVCVNLAALPGRADAAQSAAVTQPVVGQALFDDFNYTGYTDPRITQHGWTLKSGQGGPGVPGATWRPQDITFATESGNSIMRLRSGSNGDLPAAQVPPRHLCRARPVQRCSGVRTGR